MFWLLVALSGTAVRFVGTGAPDSKQRVNRSDGGGIPEPMEWGPGRGDPRVDHRSWMEGEHWEGPGRQDGRGKSAQAPPSDSVSALWES